MENFILEMQQISKSFSGVYALKDVTIKVKKGEIHALCGENGAGKSTLMNILSGVYPGGSFEGKIVLKKEPVVFRNTVDAERTGIRIIHQELNLVPGFTISENIFLGNEYARLGFISLEKMLRESHNLMQMVGLKMSPSQKVRDLGIGEQQLVEIAKCLKSRAEILILDEPTAALTENEIEILFGILENLKSEGVTCIYISHKLKEVLRLADSVTVLRDGTVVKTVSKEGLTEEKLVSMMVGRDLTDLFPRIDIQHGEKIIEVNNWTVVSRATGRTVVSNVNLYVRAGEVLGISGLIGAGRTELVSSIFGSYEGDITGEIKLKQKPVTIKNPADSVDLGIALVTEDRKKFGLILDMDVKRNVTLTSLSRGNIFKVLNDLQEVMDAQQMVSNLRVKTPSLESAVKNLSGGNQQKIVIAKWLLINPIILILDEPTRGIDVGAKREIYMLINDLTQKGLAVIIVSSELPEVLGMSDRILVMNNGIIRGELSRKDATEERVMQLATGGSLTF